MDHKKLTKFLKDEGHSVAHGIWTNCRFCGTPTHAQSDNNEPVCDECDDLEMASVLESIEVEETFEAITLYPEVRR